MACARVCRADTGPVIREAFGVTLARAQAGNQAAFACIFRDVQPGLLRYSRVIAAEVEDVAGRLRELRGRRTVPVRGDLRRRAR